MSKQIGIYKITSPTNRIYIGQSINIDKREYDYKNYSKFSKQIRLKNSVKKYGWDKHTFEIIELCSKDNLNERERYWQDYYDVLSYKGLNCKLTSSNDKCGVLSAETKYKIKNSLIGQIHSEKRKLNQSLAQLGKKRTLEHKLNMSKAKNKTVLQYDLNNNFIKEWESIMQIKNVLNYDFTCISRCCNNKQKTSYNYIWKFKQ